MKIGIIGGTGGMGKGFALRWSKNHEVIIGSRDAERAASSATEYTNLAKEAFGEINGNISGNDNVSVAKEKINRIVSEEDLIYIYFARANVLHQQRICQCQKDGMKRILELEIF